MVPVLHSVPPKNWEPPDPIVLDDAELRTVAEKVLSKKRDRPVRVVELSREPSPFATLFPADIVSVTLADDQRLTLFFKYLGVEEADHPDKLGPEREMFVYTQLLTEQCLPVVECHGFEESAIPDRIVLFLEYVDGWSLKYQDVEHWFTAARRLAALHAHFSTKRHQLECSGFLLRMDGAYYESWVGLALRVVDRRNPEWAATLEESLHDYREAGIDRLAEQPPTLVHNDLSPKNVIADTSVDPAEIHLIDWEMAGVGCAFLDLARLRYGLGEAEASRLTASYLQGLEGSSLLPGTRAQVRELLAACDIHQCLYRLAHTESWRLSSCQVLQFLDEVATLTRGCRFVRASQEEEGSLL